jgi:hypothetical protein
VLGAHELQPQRSSRDAGGGGVGTPMYSKLDESLIRGLRCDDGMGSLLVLGDGTTRGDRFTCSSALLWRSVG